MTILKNKTELEKRIIKSEQQIEALALQNKSLASQNKILTFGLVLVFIMLVLLFILLRINIIGKNWDYLSFNMIGSNHVCFVKIL